MIDEQYYLNERTEMLKYIPTESKKILEVGCGAGIFANMLKKKFNAEVWGIEPVEQFAEEAEKNLDKVINASIEDAIKQLPFEYFDCVVFNDVLEHLADPYKILSSLRKILPKGAFIVSSIPNVRYITNLKHFLIDKDWEYKKEGGILDYTHLRFFTFKSIPRLFNSTEYKIISIEGINPYPGFEFILFNICTLGFFSDSRYLQFAVRAEVV